MAMNENQIRPMVTAIVQTLQVPNNNNKDFKTPNQTEFSGRPEHINSFLKECKTRFSVFPWTFNTDVKKAYYALFLMNKGVAKAWKDRYIDSRTGQDLITTWNAFKMALTGSFADPGSTKDAMKTLQNIQQGKQSVDEHNTRFKLLLAKAKIDKLH